MKRVNILFILLFNILSASCSNNSYNKSQIETNAMKIDTTVFKKKDEIGNVIEKWGNEKRYDDNSNFRIFYTYNSQGLLSKEKAFFFDDHNVECLIVDSSDYEEILYTYELQNGKYKMIKEEKYIPVYYDSTKKVIGRELYYIYDSNSDTFLFHKSHLQKK
jgi:hypothetical protein